MLYTPTPTPSLATRPSLPGQSRTQGKVTCSRRRGSSKLCTRSCFSGMPITLYTSLHTPHPHTQHPYTPHTHTHPHIPTYPTPTHIHCT